MEEVLAAVPKAMIGKDHLHHNTITNPLHMLEERRVVVAITIQQIIVGREK